MFEIGDKIVHPTRGAGVIIGVEEKRFQAQFSRYYIIDLLFHEGTLMIPLRSADRIGLRPVISSEEAVQVLHVLSTEPEDLSNDYKTRQTRILEKLKTGDVYQVAEVLRNLTWQSHRRKLTSADTRLYEQAQKLVASELALAEGIDLHDALTQLRSALDQGLQEEV